MPESIDGESETDDIEGLEMDSSTAAFPSDALSIKRLRAMFSRHFDGPGRIADGYVDSDFFYCGSVEQPEHLFRLNSLICDERIVASGAFFECCLQQYPELLRTEERESIARAKSRLEDNYQFFKLADSPAAARLLIQQVEEEGTNQARQRRARSR